MYDNPESVENGENSKFSAIELSLLQIGAVEVTDIQINSHPRGKSFHLGCLFHREHSVCVRLWFSVNIPGMCVCGGIHPLERL